MFSTIVFTLFVCSSEAPRKFTNRQLTLNYFDYYKSLLIFPFYLYLTIFPLLHFMEPSWLSALVPLPFL